MPLKFHQICLLGFDSFLHVGNDGRHILPPYSFYLGSYCRVFSAFFVMIGANHRRNIVPFVCALMAMKDDVVPIKF